ncbi:polysaccharide lyase family protein [uncultured Bacteroides sp.]|uniref:polysaccharide lyase family protein n=1 Tax=uncultured Bacteroides sp. TaxID=162156 RepID=UPI002AA81FB2|nr:polysaccharide lyase family protein [uncultured Bacteroides sp.]
MKSMNLAKIVFVCMAMGFSSFALCATQPKVTLIEDAETYTLNNGIVTARISKVTGDLVSLRFNGIEMFGTNLSPDFIPKAQGSSPVNNPNWSNPSITGRAHAYWSHDAMGVKGSAPAIPSVTINPKDNAGKRAEVSVKAISNGRKLGTGPGTGSEGDFASDIEIRYAMEQGEPGVYTYSVFEHKPEYPLTQLGEARFCAKLADFFDWLSVAQDSKHDLYYPKGMKFGDKYVFTDVQSENRAFGWSSTTKKLGLFFINASMEYMSGGPTKVEFLGHRDTNAAAAPTVLNYWRSSHYGGAEVNVAAGEDWKKVVGPFFIYVNSGQNPEDIYADARVRAEKEAAKWPYEWVKGVDYPLAKERAVVKGQLSLKDPIVSGDFVNLAVGLTAPAYVSPRPGNGPQVITDWQRDAKFYQFWVKGNADGTFTIPNVRPGKYTLHAMTDGVLGEFVKTDVVVKAGGSLDLGKLGWKPVRHGKQVWDIGIPNRNASEFFKAEEYSDPEISLQYAVLFPSDITYTIGKSDFRKDWFFQQVPHNEDPNAKSVPFRGVSSPGRATPYTIVFDMPEAPKGKATLRLAICGTGAKSFNISVNGEPAGVIDGLSGDGGITRHGKQAIWYEKDLIFNAGLLKAGENKLVITMPAGPINNGIMYDYIRLELDENDLAN